MRLFRLFLVTLLLAHALQANGQTYLDANQLRKVPRKTAEAILRESRIWLSIEHRKPGQAAQEELFELKAKDGTTGMVIIENGIVVQVSLTLRPARAISADLLKHFGLSLTRLPDEQWRNGMRWRRSAAPFKLVEIISLPTAGSNFTMLTVDFTSSNPGS
jgi:hypothetical protein